MSDQYIVAFAVSAAALFLSACGTDQVRMVDDSVVKLPAGFTDPNCLDGQYGENPLPLSASIAHVSDGGHIPTMVHDLLKARNPEGELITQRAVAGNTSLNCVEAFAGDDPTVSAVLRRLGTVVHECGHLYDLSEPGDYYHIVEGLAFSCMGGDSVDRRGNTFARSEITKDEFEKLLPACASFGGNDSSCSSYGYIYLVSAGSNQGYNLLLEEAVQYVNSLVNAYAFSDVYPAQGSTSARDGILTFLWFVMRYLHYARVEYPDAYKFISENECFRQATLTMWGRAWHYLELTKDLPSLEIHEEILMPLVREPILLSEIQRLRKIEGCPEP